MPHYGVLRDTSLEGVDDIRGAEVYGVNDEKLGKIQDVIFDHSSGDIRYVVIDTGGFLGGKKFVVPAHRVEPYGNHDDKFYAELDKDRIQMLPEYDEKHLKSEDTWAQYEKRYQDSWNQGNVMYNKKTGRIVTPPPQEVQGTRTKPLSQEGRESLERDFTPQRRGQEQDLLGVASSGDNITLEPNRPSIADRQDAIQAQKDAEQARKNQGQLRDLSGRVPLEGSRIPDTEGLREPGIYKVDEVPDAEKKSDLNEPLNANYGRRWLGFQKGLRAGRDKVVGNCPLCGSQKKVA